MQAQRLEPPLTRWDVELATRVCDQMRAEPASRASLSDLGRAFGVSPFRVQKTFVAVMGISPRRYLEECRLALLKAHLARGEPVVGAVRGTGYSSHSWLYKDSRVKLGMTPANYKDGGAGRLIGYAVGPSEIGRLLVAATSHGICTVNVGDDDESLVNALRDEYPKARLNRSRKAARLLSGVKRHLQGQAVRLPIDIRGTDFQLRVWMAINLIPLGSTRSYGEVAAMIGEPRAVRAVANACGSNPVPLIIPCHRVIRTDGSLGGYGLGLPRKKTLLANERAMVAAAEVTRRSSFDQHAPSSETV